MKNILQELVKNSKKAIEDGIYDISENIQHSPNNLLDLIKNSKNAALITEIKFPVC